MGQSIDCQPHFGHEVGLRKASSANHAAQVGEKTAVYLLSDRLLEETLRQELTRTNEQRHDWIEQEGKPDREIIRGRYRRMADQLVEKVS